MDEHLLANQLLEVKHVYCVRCAAREAVTWQMDRLVLLIAMSVLYQGQKVCVPKPSHTDAMISLTTHSKRRARPACRMTCTWSRCLF